jgi:hypothetical protein
VPSEIHDDGLWPLFRVFIALGIAVPLYAGLVALFEGVPKWLWGIAAVVIVLGLDLVRREIRRRR